MALSAFDDKSTTPSRGDLADVLGEAIDNSPTYAEGRGVRLEIRTRVDVRSVCRLAEIKMAK
jgi:hypothetical protein